MVIMHGVKVLNLEWENSSFSYPLANWLNVGQAFSFNARWKVEKHLSNPNPILDQHVR